MRSISPFGRSVQEAGPGSELPFTLEVNDEVNDGDRLHVLGSISARTQWRLNEAIVKLSGISEGKVVGISYLPLTREPDKKSELIEADEKYAFSISIPSSNITDYQLELLWGEDATRYLTQLKESRGGQLELRNVQVETIQQPCEGKKCDTTFRLSGTLYNGTSRAINEIILAAGFIRHPPGEVLDLSKQIPENEERVTLGRIYLRPGASRAVSMNFGRIASSELNTPNGQLKPSVRIISFHTE